jgi:hypothetical protein
MKKLIAVLFIAGCINTTISCTKETAISSPKEPVETANMLSASLNESMAIQLIAGSPKFGVSVSSVSEMDKITVANKLGVKYVRAGIALRDFQGKSPTVDMYINNGFKVILNLNYDNPSNGPVPFPTDMVKYRKLLEYVLNKYTPEVAVIENEPTNRNYHSGPIENYIRMLGVAINVCKARGIKVADGCVHVKFIDQIMRGEKLNEPGLDAKKLIEAYKTLNLDYVNLHTKGEGDSYPAGLLKSAADYIRKHTAKPVMSNEFSIHTDSPDLVRSMVKGWKDGGYIYAIAFSGNSGSQALPFNNGTALTEIGRTYRDAIK